MDTIEQEAPRKPLTLTEVREAFEPLSAQYPPILLLKHASDISGFTPGTLRKKVSQGCFRNSVARGKPLRFWRERFVLELMNRPASSKPYPASSKPCAETRKADDREAA